MLVLDGTVQTTIEDEYVYHEMISHVSLLTHKNSKKALVIGGGVGGAIREIIKHPLIEKAVLVVWVYCTLNLKLLKSSGGFI